MRILALDLGKYKTVVCVYESETGAYRFVNLGYMKRHKAN